MDRVDALVIGAGVVGLATARALAQRGLETIVLEQAGAIGTGTSSRNSEVIHAGIYYATGSLKARLCVAGRDRLYAFCESRGVAHSRCGKLIVASDAAQVARLGEIERQATANGVHDLQRLSGEQARAMEPDLRVDAALLSPSTGIVDSHGLMLALQGDLEAAGGAVAVMSPVLGINASRDELVVSVGGESPTELSARIVVNAAGLWAPLLAAKTHGQDARHMPRPRFAKGNYFSLTGRSPFSRLIYPMPEAGGLGVHLTLDLAGQARFGPDVQWLEVEGPEDIDYRVDPARGDAFYAAIRSYWPALPDGALQAAYSGVRPKLEGLSDFVIRGPQTHGVPGMLHLLGIESPGLTSCLTIADEVVRILSA